MSLINPADPLARQNEKLVKIAESLMRRVEHQHRASAARPMRSSNARPCWKSGFGSARRSWNARSTCCTTPTRSSPRPTNDAEAARRNLADAIGTVSEGFALFDPDGRHGDVQFPLLPGFPRHLDRALRPGLPFEAYVARSAARRSRTARRIRRPEGLGRETDPPPPRPARDVQRRSDRPALAAGQRAPHRQWRHGGGADGRHRHHPDRATRASTAAGQPGPHDPRHARPSQSGGRHLRRRGSARRLERQAQHAAVDLRAALPDRSPFGTLLSQLSADFIFTGSASRSTLAAGRRDAELPDRSPSRCAAAAGRRCISSGARCPTAAS